MPYGASKEEITKGISKLKTAGLAAIIAEPIQGRAGVNSPPRGWLTMLSEIAHEHFGLLILDEVFTGFGRIGTLSSAAEANADISCFGKAIGGGFPISACFAKERIMNAWPESPGEAIHTGTFFGHPFSAAVGRRTILAIKEQELANRSKILGKEIKIWLSEALKESALVKDIRGEGLFLGIEYTVPGFAAVLMDKLRERGVIALPSGATGAVLSITPALNIPEDILFDALAHIVDLSK